MRRIRGNSRGWVEFARSYVTSPVVSGKLGGKSDGSSVEDAAISASVVGPLGVS